MCLVACFVGELVGSLECPPSSLWYLGVSPDLLIICSPLWVSWQHCNPMQSTSIQHVPDGFHHLPSSISTTSAAQNGTLGSCRFVAQVTLMLSTQNCTTGWAHIEESTSCHLAPACRNPVCIQTPWHSPYKKAGKFQSTMKPNHQPRVG